MQTPDGRLLLLRFTTILLLAGSIGIGNGCADLASVSIEFPLSLRGAALVHRKHSRPFVVVYLNFIQKNIILHYRSIVLLIK